ncbi:MAG: extracellular solute-binding protein [Agathobacter sp.]|nr:extracellular solute-binding protein [Agathobacter sp.]
MKRKLYIGLISLLGCALLGGCADSGSGSSTQVAESTQEETGSSDDGVVTLTIWAEEANFDLYNQMIESFKQQYPGTQFEFKLELNADADTKKNVLGDIHNAGDIFTFADDQLSSLVAGGALAKVPNASEVKAANVEGAVNACSINDIMYAYPMSADNGYFLYYDKRYFTEEDVKTLDGILNVAAANGKKFSMEWTSGWYMYSFFGNTGLEFGINDDGVTNHCNWNTTEGSITGVDVTQSLLTIGTHPGFANISDSEFVANVQNGTVIAGVSGVWNAMEIQAAWGADYGAVKLPTYTVAGQQVQMSSFVGYKMVGVNAYSEHVDWALKFADWITNEQNQTLRFEVRNQGPSNINAAASDAVQKVPAIQAVMEQSEFGVLQRVGNNYWEPFTPYGETLVAGNPNGLELQEIIDTLVAGITASTVN